MENSTTKPVASRGWKKSKLSQSHDVFAHLSPRAILSLCRMRALFRPGPGMQWRGVRFGRAYEGRRPE